MSERKTRQHTNVYFTYYTINPKNHSVLPSRDKSQWSVFSGLSLAGFVGMTLRIRQDFCR
jgi:hypothetical protein